jgi:hypothetical protein
MSMRDMGNDTAVPEAFQALLDRRDRVVVRSNVGDDVEEGWRMRQ